ncbi:MAG: methylenetetrahydrofolate--tRNA-(uracil(54)-C(5))-methyltransferase (FADH(2)-oxidizing) TrmFO [Clostridia bacterium]|nr:methylenetetrahydrofolate--tRNA-(uracil(54)-C(5))-methyltransferase (FADH(2)-oxidizing) TrmFO [Clostridia bacterium]
MKPPRAEVVGGGLAGCEAAWQLAERGIEVTLREMKPVRRSDAHRSDGLAELVCSNSLRSDDIRNAAGLLKAELETLGSLVMRAARESSVPAGTALAVDRSVFSERITGLVESHPRIRVVRGEVTEVPDGPVILAPGPLCSDALSGAVAELTGAAYLSFYDAVAPIVDAETVDRSKVFWASRYEHGSDYLNCPMNREEYERFHAALVKAERVPVKGFETGRVFEGCMPIEEMADRGLDTMRFGPLKPAGIVHPVTGRPCYALVQLRRENAGGTMLNLVGFQTHLRFSEQRRVFGMIPGLENAEFLRYGVMHRNTYIDAPRLLDGTFTLRREPHVQFAGQITGVEGYIESAASGFLAGVFLAARLLRLPQPQFDNTTALGGLIAHITNGASADYQPMNINFGLMQPLAVRIRNKRERSEQLARRALDNICALRAGSPLWQADGSTCG